MKILAIDLGKFKSVACLFDTETNQAEYETIAMQQVALEDLLQRKQPQKVVIETCTVTTQAKSAQFLSKGNHWGIVGSRAIERCE
jgi:nicotinamide riboside kinase